MLTRRQLLTRGTTVLLLAPILSPLLSSCSSSSGDDTGGGTCDGIDSTSTVNASHSHTVCVPTTDLTSPPSAGATYTSSNDGNHTHTIMLTMAQLTMIEAGTAVTVTSSSDVDPINGADHTHDWTLMKA
jgi:hypothetical protein